MRQDFVDAKRITNYAKMYIIALIILCFTSLMIFSSNVFYLLLPLMCLNMVSNYWLSYKIEESLKICKKAQEELYIS